MEEETLTVRLPSWLKKAAEVFSDTHGMTLTGAIRRALEELVAPPARSVELPGLSTAFQAFLDGNDLKTHGYHALLLGDEGGGRFLYAGKIDLNLTEGGLVGMRPVRLRVRPDLVRVQIPIFSFASKRITRPPLRRGFGWAPAAPPT